MAEKGFPLTSFKRRLSLTVILLNLLVYGIAGFSSYHSWVRGEKEAAVSARNLASVLDHYIDGELDSIDIALLAVKHEIEEQPVHTIDVQRINRFIAQQHSYLPQLQGMRFLDSKGNVLYGTGGVTPGTTANMADRDYFIHARNHPKSGLFVSKPVFGRVAKQWVINVARRVDNPDGSFAGVIYAALALEHYVHIFSSIDIGEKGTVTLRDSDLGIIVRHPDPKGLGAAVGDKAVHPDLPKYIASGKESGLFAGRSRYDNTDRLFAFRKISDYPLYLVVALAKEEYLADWRREGATLMVLVLSFTVVTLFTSRMLFAKWKREKETETELRQAKDKLELRVAQRTEDLNRSNQQLTIELEERKQAELALQESRQQLVDIIDFLPDATFVIDNDKRVIAWNRAMEEMTGIAKKDMIGRSDHSYTIPFYGERRQQLLDLLELDGDDLNAGYENLTRKGDTLYAEVFAPALHGGKGAYLWLIGAPLYNSAGERFGAIESIRDITEKKRAEEQRNNDVALIESLLINSPTGIRVFDAETGQCLLVNQSAVDIAGGTKDALLAQNFRQLESWKVSGLIDVAEQVIIDGVPRTRETVLHTSFDRELPVMYQFSRFIVLDRPYLLVIGRDVSDEKKMAEEKRRIEEKMLHAQKLESMGVLAGGIAHDFNNILTAIIGNSELALKRMNPESPAQENLQRIEKAAERAAELAQQMLAYSGKGKFIIENIDLNRLVEEMLHMLEVSISKKAVLRLNLNRPLPFVEGDATQLRQIIMNLVINASEAIGDKSGVIAITSGYMECDRNYLKDVWLDENLSDGDYVFVEVADTGCGMDRETLSRIFDPFFTTKFTGRGLGMAAVLGIVRGHKGAIRVYSEPGKGSSFKVLFPAGVRAEEGFISGSVNDSWKGGGTVLLVDDEEILRSLGSEMLHELGFDVITAEDGKHAVEIFETRDDIDVVLLDLTMPHMDGEQTFRELRRIRPDIRIIMSSGYNEQEVTRKFPGHGLSGFIQKPYKLSTMREVFRNLPS